MTILGIETSTAVCSVGFVSESGLCAERSLFESHIHSEKLLTLVRGLCEDQKVVLSHIDGVAISIGPGSFTGLRIGLSTAKGLCFSMGKLLIAVPAFEAVADAVFTSHPQCSRVVVCVDAKQGEYYFGAYENIHGISHEILPVQIGNLAAAISAVKEKTIVVTDRMTEVQHVFADRGRTESIFPYCRGDSVARRAIEKLKQGAHNAPENLEPMYLKDFVLRTHLKA